MTKQLTQKQQVAVFVRYQPNCAVGDVAEALDMSGATAGKLLRDLSDEGVIVRSRNSVQYTYEAVPHADIPDAILPCMLENSDPVRMQAAWRLRRRGYGEELPLSIRTCLVSPGVLLRLPVLPSAGKTACARRGGHN